jgi:hypothetical protein
VVFVLKAMNRSGVNVKPTAVVSENLYTVFPAVSSGYVFDVRKRNS